jgi:hypothetical protein
MFRDATSQGRHRIIVECRFVCGSLRTPSAQYRKEDFWSDYPSYSKIEILTGGQHQ